MEMEAIKVLIIDDEQSVYDIVSHYCKKNSNYAIELKWLNEIPEDITQINRTNFSLLLLDYHINQRTGLELLELLNADSKKQVEEVNLPVIMLSNADDIQIAANAIHYGISEFIPKPNLSADLLNRTINNVVYKNKLKLQLIDTKKELEASNRMLQRKNEEISNFYQVISHELKTPLTSTYEFINILLDGITGELTDDQTEYLGICQRNCKQLAQYINDLLEIGRISTGKFNLTKGIVNLNKVLVDVVNTSKILAESKHISLLLDTVQESVEIEADEMRIYQALLVLVNNAIKFSPEHETIQLILEHDKNQKTASISVVDHGCGIAAEHHEKIFDRLFQTNTYNVGSHAGLGLGLYICKQIVQLHHGSIELESAPGKGSRFRLKFPYNLDQNDRDAS